MPKYKYFQDEKNTMWQRHAFTVTAESEKVAEAIICESGLSHKCITDICDARICLNSSETLFETQYPLSPEENNGEHTLEVLTADKRRSICTNADDMTFDLAENKKPSCAKDRIKAFICYHKRFDTSVPSDAEIIAAWQEGPQPSQYDDPDDGILYAVERLTLDELAERIANEQFDGRKQFVRFIET